MDDKRNIIMAVLLTGIILFGWPVVMDKFFPDMAAKNEVVENANNPANDQRPIDGQQATTVNTGTIATEMAAPQIRSLGAALAESPRVAIKTPRLEGSINLTGAKIDDLTLTDHRMGIDKKSAPVQLFSPSGTKDAYFSRFGWTGTGVAVPDDKAVWTPNVATLTPETPVTLRWANETGQTFLIKLSIDKNYLISADQTIVNRSEAPVAVTPYGLVSRVRDLATAPATEKSSWTIHIGPMGVFEDSANYDWNYEDITENPNRTVDFKGNNAWIGFTDKYWLAALVPAKGKATDAKFRSGSGNIFQAQVSSENANIVAPGKQLTTTTRLFAGAKETILLDKYKNEQGITLLDKAIDWGWFYWFEKPIFYVLHWLFEATGNFGIAIIILTFIVRGIMFPIAQKQFGSMAQMRAVQPKMKKIQEKHKEDKQKQQQEIMKLYKEEKVNPLAGCLPIFLQIPIFFALYKVLMLSIEMRHQPFMLWIHDLSAPDPLTPVNLFGLIPFDPPTFLAIGILPILMGITMHFQFKLNPQQMDPIQQQIFGFMPIILVFIMAPFAAGLQLYWTVSNLLTIAQQKWLYSRHPQLKEMIAKDAEEKARKAAEEKAEA